MDVLIGTPGGVQSIPLEIEGERAELSSLPANKIDFVLPTGGGLAYGDFTLDDASRKYLLEHLTDLKDPVARGASWVTLWEELLDRRVQPSAFVDLGLRALPLETTEQNIQLIVGHLTDAYWHFLNEAARVALAPKLEQAFRAGWTRSNSSSLKSVYFRGFRSVVRTPE